MSVLTLTAGGMRRRDLDMVSGGGGRGGREHLPYPLLQTHHTNYSPDPVFSNWPTNTNPKTTTYVNPILTESDSNESESLSSEEEEGGWEDYLDVGFGD